jgi:Predicted phosphohydrolases
MLSSISFIHLSDIHFNKHSGDVYDLDKDLRNELLRDIKQNASKYLENVKGVLVCGDIAFSGKSHEYKVASDFLSEVCSSLGIPDEAVFCVPGNHDVDQSVPAQSPIIKTMQDKIAEATTRHDIDSVLTSFSRDTKNNNLLYAPIECYNNEFAGKFSCYISPQNPTWEFRFGLGEKYTLRLFGLNSTVISNADDHAPCFKDDRPMVIGQFQIPSRSDNAIYLTICHHPPECWQDPENILKNRMDSRVQIQLYGHKHEQTIYKTEKTLILNSGATHPSRGEPNWTPRYNWISLKATSNGEGVSCLSVKVFPRILDNDGDHYVVDRRLCQDGIYVDYEIPLISKEDEISKRPIGDIPQRELPEISLDTDVDIKSLTYAFLKLPYVVRDKIISKLFLRKEQDEGYRHVEIIALIFKRAEEQGCINTLWEEIQKNKK